jgi:hypothetical protein
MQLRVDLERAQSAKSSASLQLCTRGPSTGGVEVIYRVEDDESERSCDQCRRLEFDISQCHLFNGVTR